MNDSFNEDALWKALSSRAKPTGRYTIAHVASHFAFNPADASQSYLLLGDGKPLSLMKFKVGGRRLSGIELLTLSACETAVAGANSNGQEVDGFGEIAQNAGARAVIATLWSVYDTSTSLLMRRLYAGKAAQPSISKAHALTLAQLSLLRGTKGADGKGVTRSASPVGAFKEDPGRPFSHPYYWAPFILIGGWNG